MEITESPTRPSLPPGSIARTGSAAFSDCEAAQFWGKLADVL
jgi:hypothetical protein